MKAWLITGEDTLHRFDRSDDGLPLLGPVIHAKAAHIRGSAFGHGDGFRAVGRDQGACEVVCNVHRPDVNTVERHNLHGVGTKARWRRVFRSGDRWRVGGGLVGAGRSLTRWPLPSHGSAPRRLCPSAVFQPDAGAAAILGDELDAGRLEGALELLKRVEPHTELARSYFRAA
jgi:hypothetical protein